MSILRKIFKMFNNPLKENNPEIEADPSRKPIPFRPVRVNSITLSTDMRTVYLIDRDRAAKFLLDSDEGVFIGLLRKQLAVVTAPEAPPEVKPDEVATLDNPSLEGKKRLLLPVPRNQWTLLYNDPTRSLGVIGATDVTLGVAVPGEERGGAKRTVESRLFLFNLEKQVLQVRLKNNLLEITFLDI